MLIVTSTAYFLLTPRWAFTAFAVPNLIGFITLLHDILAYYFHVPFIKVTIFPLYFSRRQHGYSYYKWVKILQICNIVILICIYDSCKDESSFDKIMKKTK